jgi:predicted adenine nucleotide alpha hydrolase (AANH) superfamily ATPase
MSEIKIFEMNDYDYYAGETLFDCVTQICRDQGCASDECYILVALTDEQMNKLQYWYDNPSGPTISFRKRLNEMIAEKTQFPCFFASSEY